jgi:hypothetical protein
MAGLLVLGAGERGQWLSLLRHSFQHDVYHLPAYHALSEEQGEGSARLFVYREGESWLAVPLLLRPVDATPGLESAGKGYWDATSVYGYAGPVASQAGLPEAVRGPFRRALAEALRDLGVVSLFSRLHPLISQAELLSGLGECPAAGKTVSVDLTLPAAAQGPVRVNHQDNIRKLERLGVTCLHDEGKTYLDDFIEMYQGTMRRVGASGFHCFGGAYLAKLAREPQLDVHLFVCLWKGQPVCAGLLTACAGLAQCHLIGTLDEYVRLAPAKLLIDGMRRWACAAGLRVFHLGGGVGAREDSLFHFKAGFSDRRHDFSTWRWVLLPDVHGRLCETRSIWNERNGLVPVSPGFFPDYRAPARAESGPTASACEGRVAGGPGPANHP